MFLKFWEKVRLRCEHEWTIDCDTRVPNLSSGVNDSQWRTCEKNPGYLARILRPSIIMSLIYFSFGLLPRNPLILLSQWLVCERNHFDLMNCKFRYKYRNNLQKKSHTKYVVKICFYYSTIEYPRPANYLPVKSRFGSSKSSLKYAGQFHAVSVWGKIPRPEFWNSNRETFIRQSLRHGSARRLPQYYKQNTAQKSSAQKPSKQ